MKPLKRKEIKSSVKQVCSENKRYSLLLLFLILVDLQFGFFRGTIISENLDLKSQQSSIRMSSALYFIHGYAGDNQDFTDMVQYLNQTNFLRHYPTGNPYFFDYFAKYNKSGLTRHETHFVVNGISAYATDFYHSLQSTHDVYTRIDIIAHSLGGIIVREMLRLFHSELEKSKIIISRIITLGTPHLGTKLANHPLKEPVEVFAGDKWDTPIIDSLTPECDFINRLNDPTLDYMNNVNWYFVGGISLDPICYLGKRLVFDGLNCDGFVDWRSALAMKLDIKNCLRLVVEKTHHNLYHDPKQEIYQYIHDWIKPDFRVMEPQLL
jgi:hypothetical protein